MVIPTFMLQIADFLNIIIFQNSFIFFNLWSFVHLVIPFLIMYYFLKDNQLHYLFFLLVLYELFEMSIIFFGLNLFRAELPIDIVFDLIVGMVGGMIAIKWRKRNDKE